MQVQKLVNEAEDLVTIKEGLVEEASRKELAFSISKEGAKRWRRKPTGEGSCSKSTRQRRRNETVAAVNAIHGGQSNLKSGTFGMLETLDSKCSEQDVVSGVKKCQKIKGKVLPKVYKDLKRSLDNMLSSLDNMLRSIAVYYRKGVMGKGKYRLVYKDSSYRQVPGRKRAVHIKVANCPSPQLVPYHRLMSYIKSIDNGQLHSVRKNLCDGLDECDKFNGCYKDIEDLLVRLAEFYMNHGKYNLLTFDQPNTFHVALGGDGAPFGKNDTACSWLVSFLNIGQGVLSSNDNFLLFGANCTENCLLVKRFLGKLMSDIKRIQSYSYSILAKGASIDMLNLCLQNFQMT